MIEIKTGEELTLDNVLSYRGKLAQSDMDKVIMDMDAILNTKGVKRCGYPIMATYGVEGIILDVELIIPIDGRIENADKYVFKEKIKIVNAAKLIYKGHPNGLQGACNELNKYIMENNLQPITVGYNVTRKVDMLNIDDTEIDVYVGISPNIL